MDIGEKGIQRAVPKGFPYMLVEWETKAGERGALVHVIEDEKVFKRNFAQDVLAGMMDLPTSAMLRSGSQETASAGETLARDVYARIEEIAPAPGLGVKEGYSTFGGQGMYELKRTTAPAILAEVAFHDNPEDAQFIIDNIYELGQAVAKGVLDYFGIEYVEDTPENVAYLQNRYNGIYA